MHQAQKLWFFGLLAESYLAVLGWGVLTTLWATVWFIPLDAMNLEPVTWVFCLMAFVTIGLSGVTSLHPIFLKYQSIWFLIALAGVLSFLANNLTYRLALHSISFGLVFAIFLGRLWFANPKRQLRTRWAFMLAILASICLRFGFLTLHVFWLSSTHTIVATAIGVLCCIILWKDNDDIIEPPTETSTSYSLKTDLRFGFGFGCLLGMAQHLVTVPGMLARWLDLDTFPYGIGALLCVMIGFFLSQYHTIVRSNIWYLTALLSSIMVMTLQKEIAIFFGYILIIYIMSLWHVVGIDLSRYTRTGRTLGITFIVYFNYCLATIWSVAWCFVPPGTGGEFMRQRIPQIICFCVWGIGFAYYKEDPKEIKNNKDKENFNQKNRKMDSNVLVIFVLIFFLIFVPSVGSRWSHWNEHDSGVPTDHIRAMVWAIRFGYDNYGWPNFDGLVHHIKDQKANIISLVETDMMRMFNGPYDGIEFLENKLHMYSDYGPSNLNDTWGCAILSAYPIVSSDKLNLPSPEGETACFIDATLDVNGIKVDVMSVHVGNTQHYWDREQQIDEIIRRSIEKKKKERPFLLIGYLTANPKSSTYNRLVKAGLIDTSPNENDRYCLYHWHYGLVPKNFKRIPHRIHKASDTEIQIADYYFPANYYFADHKK